MHSVSELLRGISRYGRQYREMQLAPLELNSRQGMYIREICAAPGISQEQLAQILRINKSNVARQVAAMEEDGYIERRCCGKDKRVMRLYPTQKTLDLLPEIDRIMDSWQEMLTQDQVLVGVRLQHLQKILEQLGEILGLKADMNVDLPPELLLEGEDGGDIVLRVLGLDPHARAEVGIGLGHVIRKAEHAKALPQSRFNIPPLAGLGVPATVGVGVVVRFHMGSVPHLEKIMQIWG